MAHIQYERGSIFDSKAHVIVNTVNCEGFMGKGLALAFKQRYPDMFAVYQEECKSHRLRIGRPTLYKETTPWNRQVLPNRKRLRKQVDPGLLSVTKRSP